MDDLTRQLKARVEEARKKKTPLVIRGGGTKLFYGRDIEGEPLEIASYRGIVEYRPGELFITVRAGTRLAELERVLAEENQTLAAEPPHLGEEATVGGMVAVGFSGPRRPFAGAVRDHVLGMKVLTGRGEILEFGGKLVKNVAGFDLGRLMVGSLGTLAVILEVTLRVQPKPKALLTLRKEMPKERALSAMSELQSHSLPLSGLAYEAPYLYVRFEGEPQALEEAREGLGGEVVEGDAFWRELKELKRPFFREGEGDLWRITLPPASPFPELEGEWLIDWGGAQRWLKTQAPPEKVFAAVEKVKGQAAFLWGREKPDPPFSPMPENLKKIHLALKKAFDPERILNRGRLDPEI